MSMKRLSTVLWPIVFAMMCGAAQSAAQPAAEKPTNI